MPRALRIESNEGLYHVINRGNYRSFIFGDEGAKKGFETCLFEACERFGWELLAYCVMSNHFHLCLATPKGNLSEGMRWLQGTYAARFNRYRHEKGHLFQGRFKSLLVEPGTHLTTLVDYIHLNPVRADLVEIEAVSEYRWSSLHWFLQTKKMRPSFLDSSWLDYFDGIIDSSKGWKHYQMLLQTTVELDTEELEKLEVKLCRGWCIGDKEFKRVNVEAFLSQKETLRLEKEGLVDLNESYWAELLQRCLEGLGKSEVDVRREHYSVRWKLAIATRMKEISSVRNKWLSEHLNMGVPRGVSSNCGIYSKEKGTCTLYAKLVKLDI